MGDLKEIKQWHKKAIPNIYALEPRMLFDGTSITIPESIDPLIVPPKIISVTDSISSQLITNGATVFDPNPIKIGRAHV